MAVPAPSRHDDDSATSASPLLSLYRQLRDRHVIKTAGLYAVGAWGIIQVLATVQPALDLPPVLVTISILLAIAGFIPACILAWAYDLTPPHILRAEPLPEDAPTSWRMVSMLVGVAALSFVTVGGIGWAVWRGHERGGGMVARAEAQALPTAQFPPDHVAVLEFEDLTPSHDRAYLASALTESLIDQLGSVEALHVISRTGAGHFTATISSDSIGRALTVGTIIKGSVLEDRGVVRVIVQAVNAADGEVLARTAVERPAGELLPLVDDIVGAVSAMVRQRIGQAVEIRRWQAGTRDEIAWTLLQKARELREGSDKLRAQGENALALQTLRRADSVLAVAERRDSHWSAPSVERAVIERRVAFLLLAPWQMDAPGAMAAMDRAVAHADAALARSPGDPAALEERGVIAWYRWVFTQGRAGDAVISRAEQDLRLALAHDVRRPRAWATLSAVLLTRGEWSGANAAAQTAYDEDAYLEDASEVVGRAFLSSFQLRDDVQATRWCAELRRLAPGSWFGARCVLQLMAYSPAVRPDPAGAWRARNDVAVGSDAPQLLAMYRSHLDMLVAAVLARAGLADSARAVLARARETGPRDPDAIELEAGARAAMGDRRAAGELLRDYASTAPAWAPAVLRKREFATLARPLEPVALHR